MKALDYLGCASLALVLSHIPAMAQAADAAQSVANGGAGSPIGLEEVVVTAQRQSSTVQRTPATIEVLNGANLAERGVGSLDDALSSVPGVYIMVKNKGVNVNVRGVGTGLDSAAGDPGVNTNIDGVYLRQSSTFAAGLYDIERIEVLKGPQGTLYGRNATGGVVNILTADPGPDYGYRGSITVGDHNLVRTDAALNIPLSSTLAVRAAFGSESRQGYLDTGQDDAQRTGARLKVLWTPTPSVRLLAGASYGHEGGIGPGSVAVTEPEGSRHSFVAQKPAGQLDQDFLTAFATLEWDAGPVRVTFIPTHSDYSYDYIGTNYSFYSQQRAREQQTTLELRLSSPVESRVKWVAGLYYYANDLDNFVNLFSQGIINKQPELKTRSYAGFADATVPLTDTLRVIGGVRYTQDDRSQRNTTLVGGGVNVGPLNGDLNSNAFNYRLGGQIDLTPSVMAYATYSTGYKAGGFMPDEPGYNTFEPERVRSIEGGIKSRLFDNRLQLNLAGFHYNYDNYQVSSLGVAHYGGLSARVFNSQGTTEIYGAEVQLSYRPTDNDQFDLSLSPLHSKFGTFVIPATRVSKETIVTGKEVPSAPGLSGSVAYQHDWSFGEGRLTGRAESFFSSSYWTEYSHAAKSQRPGYTRTDLNLTYHSENDRWSVGAFAKNVEDSWIVTLKANTAVGDYGLLAPRTFGVTLSMRN